MATHAQQTEERLAIAELMRDLARDQHNRRIEEGNALAIEAARLAYMDAWTAWDRAWREYVAG